MGNWMAATSIGSALICSGIAVSKNFTVQGAEQARMENEIAAQMQSETEAQYRSRLLKVVANEWKNIKLTTIVAFDKNGELKVVPPTQKEIKKHPYLMEIGMKLDGLEGGQSVSIYNPVTKQFAALEKKVEKDKDGRENVYKQVKFIYSEEEIKKS